MKKAVVYSGSFNPMHKGHIQIIDSLSKRYDIVRVLVTPQNPFKGEELRDNYEERYNDAINKIDKEIIKGNKALSDKIIVDDIENELSRPNYTYRTLCQLDIRHSNEEYILALGSDCLENFDKWKCWKKILRQYGLLIFKRAGYDENKLLNDLVDRNPLDKELILYNIRFVYDKIENISSTEIREKNNKVKK